MKVSFINGHIIEFSPQTQKIESSSRCPKVKMGVNQCVMNDGCL